MCLILDTRITLFLWIKALQSTYSYNCCNIAIYEYICLFAVLAGVTYLILNKYSMVVTYIVTVQDKIAIHSVL